MIIITGQTATGKTKLALKYAKRYNGEIISCDSRQIYKYLDIITGKDLDQFQIALSTTSLIDNIRPIRIIAPVKTNLWLYDVILPNEYFSSFNFAQLAKKITDYLIKKGKTPIIVGGTYLYLKHFLYGFNVQVPPNWQLRKALEKYPKKLLQNKLKELDPEIEQKMNYSDWQNPRRLVRKLEIYFSSNKSYQSKKFSYPITHFFGLYFSSKEKLKQAIEKRVEERLKKGAIAEVKKVLNMGYKPTDPGLQTIGYRQIIKYLQKQLSLKEAINEWIKEEINYAKRQMTFMKKDKNITWQSIDDKLLKLN